MDRAKRFEVQFKKDWCDMKGAFALRLPDQQSGYYGASSNPCDFICYCYPYFFMLEIKSHKGNTFPFSAFRQYEKLKAQHQSNIPGLEAGVILWMIEHDKIIYIPIESFIEMEKDDKKSFNIKYLETQEYKCFEIPSVKKRTFFNSDYTVLIDYMNVKNV